MEVGAQALPKKSNLTKWILILAAMFLLFLIFVCLGITSAFRAMMNAQRAPNLTEISQLDQAMSDYKARANTFPPCMGDADEEVRQKQFFTHVVRAFPRYVATDVKLIRNYLDIREQVLINFNGKEGRWYDLDTMDQAEALVFWLGGFPTPRAGGTPTGELLAPSKLLGFCSSHTGPFFAAPGKPFAVFDSPKGNSLNRGLECWPFGFQFDEARLVDQDGDGWLEYIPMGISTTGLVAPFVYFDAELYNEHKTSSSQPSYRPYPSAIKGSPTFGPANNPAASAWGAAVPYAVNLPHDNKSQLTWANPRKFQIICAGMDNNYGVLGPPPSGFSENLPKIYPNGIRYDPKGADDDNLTNFSDGRQLGDAQ